jgi:hypothetical protein
MNFEIQPYVGAGIIKFGMSQSTIRQLMLGNDVQDFKRNSNSISDYYEKAGLFIYYDKNKIVEAIEFHQPATVVLGGICLFSIKALDAYSLIYSLDNNVVNDNDGLTSFTLGVGFYAPHYNDNSSLPLESIIVFRQGYYDN